MIKLKNVSKYYSSEETVTMALNNINLTFDDVGFVAITGESGSGKSTLLNVISGMDTYEDGEVYYGEQETSYFDANDWENYRRNNVSIIYQSYNLIDSYSAVENIEVVLKMDTDLSKDEIRKKALEVLDKVGLTPQAKKKASHLSSGQKQRLGIARALAKDTNVIIADEPTGNLDVENGKAVMAILSELSKDRLVIVVTHNYEQAEPYVDRKIRLFDGKVVEDIRINNQDEKQLDASKFILHEKAEKIVSNIKNGMHLALKNIKSQPNRTFFIFVLVLFYGIASFLFIGTLASAVDDTSTKKIETTAFKNVDKTRIIVKNKNDKEITLKDIETLRGLDYVKEVDMYDNAADLNYYCNENEDYAVYYESNATETYTNVELEFLKADKYVKSVYCIEDKKLLAGEMPKSYNEIIVCSNDKSLIGTQLPVYFTSSQWDRGEYAYIDGKITGIVADETEQIYFSKEFVESLNANAERYEAELIISFVRNVDYEEEGKEDYNFTRDEDIEGHLVVNNELADDEIKIGVNHFYDLYTNEEDGVKEFYEENTSLTAKIKLKGTKADYSEEGYELKLCQEGSNSSEDIMEVNYNTFKKIVKEMDVTQCSIYAEDYAYVGRILESIEEAGYESISVFNISALEYDEELLKERMMTLLISAVSLIVIFILSIVVIFGMLKVKTNDFVILKGLGVKTSIINFLNYNYLYILTVISVIVTIVVANILAANKIELVQNCTKYMTTVYYFIWVVLCFIVATCAAKLFNRSLAKRFR